MSDRKHPLDSHVADELLTTLRTRFEANMERHPALNWDAIEERILSRDDRLWSLHLMESTGGEPDVIGYDAAADEFLVVDCSVQSPTGRRNLCYDQTALEARKANKPGGSAVEAAAEMGIELLDEARYRDLQRVGAFDTTTSSWIVTPESIRARGGAIFGDRRYDSVFIYHNGADSYYAARGFRGMLRV